jgi:hypothetical protein
MLGEHTDTELLPGVWEVRIRRYQTGETRVHFGI